jgi:hypothetical protein
MTSQLTMALSYKKLQSTAGLPKAVTEFGETRILELMTLNFRMCFWRIFERVWKIEFDRTVTEVFGLPATLSEVHLLEARPAKAREGPDYVLVAIFHFDVDAETLARARSNVRERLVSSELVTMYETLLRATPAAPVVAALSAELAGHSSWSDTASDTALAHLAYVTGFYHYGWILALRIDREHIRMNLSTREISDRGSAQTILHNRIQLIQIQRYFLNEDRTNNKELQGVCARLRNKYKLEHRFERLSRVHRAMEEHLDNTFKVAQSNATRATNAAIRLLTLCAVPLGIMSVLLTLNLTSSVFSEFNRVATDGTLRILLAASFLAPFVLVFVAWLIDRMANSVRE